MATPSQVPTRLPAGLTTDPPFGPLADCGNDNPVFYHQFYDDFDNSLGPTGLYTENGTSGYTAAHTAGDGGLATLTTAAASGDYAQIQLPAASFSLPYQSSPSQATGKKLFFLTRVELSDVTNSALLVGLCNTSTDAFSSTTDGVYFSKASGSSTNLSIVYNVGGTAVTTVIPTSAYTLVNATFVDLAFYIDRYGNINVFAGYPLVGYNPQSGSGSGGPYVASGVYGSPQIGRVLQIATPTLSLVNLSPTLAIQAGAAAAKSVTTDFWVTSKER